MTGDRSTLGAGAVAVNWPHDPSAIAVTVRMARAALGWSQREFGRHLGITQRTVHRIEQGRGEPRRTTLLAIESLLRRAGIGIEQQADGVLCIVVPAAVLSHREPVDVAAPSLSDCSPMADGEDEKLPDAADARPESAG